jgi:hypothetical protein
MATEEVKTKTRTVIEAPNGLCESDRSWTQMVSAKHNLGRPTSLAANPPFDPDLERAAPLGGVGKGSRNQAVLFQLERSLTLSGSRQRTALGLAFEELTADWFQLEERTDKTPPPLSPSAPVRQES